MLRGDFEDERERTIALSHLGRPEHEIGLSSGLTPWVTSTPRGYEPSISSAMSYLRERTLSVLPWAQNFVPILLWFGRRLINRES